MVATYKNVPLYWNSPESNYWVCDSCGSRFSIIDEQPTIVETSEKMDVTTFGDPKQQWLVQRVAERFCSSCT